MYQKESLSSLILSLCLFLLFPSVGLAQKEGNIWYFGANAGLDFNSGKPVALIDGQMNTYEGCATIADSQGRLLFYTDGISVWNRNHNQMSNGYGLFGDPSSTQSGVIVPYPGDANLYYVFTVDAQAGGNGMCYSIVDMRKGNGLGDVTLKNKKLFSPAAEKITAVRHANGKHIWVVGHEWGTDVFRAYLVTELGVSSSPAITAIGAAHKGNNLQCAIGQMVSATDGSRIALSCFVMKNVELFDFDNRTGELSNAMSFPAFGDDYGVAFSPDNTKLYFSNLTGPALILQYDLTAGSPAQVLNSKYEVVNSNSASFSAMQIGPDGKIYIARFNKDYLDAIENPNSVGSACQYKNKAVGLNSKICWHGLPTIMQSVFHEEYIGFNSTCEGDSTRFYFNRSLTSDTFSWNFGDPESGLANTSTSDKPNHRFTNIGKYTVTLAIRRKGTYHLVQTVVVIGTLPRVILPSDTTICSGRPIVLDVSTFPAERYEWSTGSTAKSITITESGTYWVELSNGPCKASDTIRIFGPPDVPGTLGPDRAICPGQTVKLRTNIPAKAYLWSDGSTDTTLKVSQGGTYWVDMIMNCKTFRDSVVIFNTVPPAIELGKDTQLCQGDTLVLDAAFPFASYLWQDSSTASSYIVTKTGTYIVTVSNPCGTVTDSIRVTYIDPPYADLGRDTLLCLGDSIVWDLQQPFAQYLWQDGSTSSRLVARNSGKYIVKVSRACHTQESSVNLEFEDCTCYLYAPNTFSPNGDKMNDTFYVSPCKTTDFLLQVYNRWGERVFESADIAKGWDGTYRGRPVPEGVYLYITQARGKDRKWYLSKGQVTVVR